MGVWDYSSISAEIARAEAGCYYLHPASLVLLRAGLSALEVSETWRSAGVELTSSESDNVDAWVDSAFHDLLSVGDCGGDLMGFPYVDLAHIEDLTTHGGAVSVGWNECTLNTIEQDESSILYALSNNLFAFKESGLYRLTVKKGFYIGSGFRVLALYQDTYPSAYIAQSEMTNDTTQMMAQFTVELNNTKGYALHLYSNAGQVTYGMGYARNVGLYERYTSLRIEQISV